MSKPVEITLPERTFVCDENSKASVIFTVTNIIDDNVDLAASINVEDNDATKMQPEWLEIKLDSNWSLDAKATEEVTVNVTIPDDQPLGDYRFKLTVYSKENPGDDFTTSEMICVKKQKIVEKQVEIKKGFPWWMLAVAALFIVVGGVAWYFTSTTALPDVKGASSGEAREMLLDKDLEVIMETINFTAAKAKAENVKDDHVYEQIPDAKETSRVDKGTKVTLKIASVSRSTGPVVVGPVVIDPVVIKPTDHVIVKPIFPLLKTGTYTIQQKSNGRYMDAHEGSDDNSVVTRNRQNDSTQLWVITSLGKSTYTIQQKSNRRYMDAHEGSNDSSVVTRNKQNNNTQRWLIKPLGNNTYTIQQKSNNQYLDAHEGSNDNSVVTRKKQNNDTQRWIIKPK